MTNFTKSTVNNFKEAGDRSMASTETTAPGFLLRGHSKSPCGDHASTITNSQINFVKSRVPAIGDQAIFVGVEEDRHLQGSAQQIQNQTNCHSWTKFRK